MDKIEKVTRALLAQMEAQDDDMIPSSIQRGNGLVWLEGWFDLRAAIAALDKARGWQPIETAPHEELLVLGWYEGSIWKQEIALASAGQRWDNGYSNRWFHGRATHWMPLPQPPAGEGGA